MIDTIDPGAIGTAGSRGTVDAGELCAALSTPGAAVRALELLQPDADARRRGAGAGPVNGLLMCLVSAVDGGTDVGADGGSGGGRDGGTDADAGFGPEFGGALVVEVVRRYLSAVRDHERACGGPRVWRLVLDEWAGAGWHPARIALAGAHALVALDLPPAVVSTCTLLGRTPGPVERGEVQAVAVLLAGLVRDAARRSGDPATVEAAGGLEPLFTRGECWRQAEHLWTVRGRPSEAERDRDALDWRAALVARGVLA